MVSSPAERLNLYLNGHFLRCWLSHLMLKYATVRGATVRGEGKMQNICQLICHLHCATHADSHNSFPGGAALFELVKISPVAVSDARVFESSNLGLASRLSVFCRRESSTSQDLSFAQIKWIKVFCHSSATKPL